MLLSVLFVLVDDVDDDDAAAAAVVVVRKMDTRWLFEAQFSSSFFLPLLLPSQKQPNPITKSARTCI